MQDEPATPEDAAPDSEQVLVDPLDADQLRRIKATHRGFLYQHLYAIGCLMRLEESGAKLLSVERDEDLEVVLPGRWLYLQVKTRTDALRWGDIRGSVGQFDDIRKKHTAGQRSGTPMLIIVTNTAPGPRLLAKIQGTDWPDDVRVLWPGGSQVVEAWLPAPGRDIADMLGWCTAEAQRVPFPSLAPRTLVWKLAALVQYACTGARAQSFSAAELPSLYEQFVEDLQAFPAAPEFYRPQADEPALVTKARVQLVVGFSGAGKTTWAAQAAAHCPVPVTYFDVAGMPCDSVAGSLARGLAARHLSGGSEGVQLPHGSGLDILRAVHLRLSQSGLAVAVVLDNVHQLPSDVLRPLVEALPTERLTLLGQPWRDRSAIESLLGVTAEVLPGWNSDTIAAAFTAEGCTLDYPTAQRVLGLTAGLPLYVLNSALLTKDVYSADGSAFCEAFETQTHIAPTAQELILEKTFDQLTETARTVASLLALAEVPLTRAELQQLAVAADLPGEASNARALRTLAAHGLTQTMAEGHVKLHDAARPLVESPSEGLSKDTAHRVLHALSRLLDGNGGPTRLARWMRVLAETDQINLVLALSEREGFYEAGYSRELRTVLTGVAEDPGRSTSSRFDARNALSIWAGADGDWNAYACHLEAMGAHLEAAPDEFGVRDWSLLTTRQLALYGRKGNLEGLDNALTEGLARVPTPSRFERVLRYSYAHGLYEAGAYAAAGTVVMQVATAYETHLGLTRKDLFERPIAELEDMCRSCEDPDDYKRLADCFSTYVRTCRKLKRGWGPWAIPARRLYTVAGAWRSAVCSGQDVVDTFLDNDQFGDALNLLDTMLLPIAEQFHLPDLVVGLRSQRAVVLAWNGDIAAARAEMASLTQYEATPDQALDIRHQTQLIEDIAAQTQQQAPPA